jgi:hypothetical protein
MAKHETNRGRMKAQPAAPEIHDVTTRTTIIFKLAPRETQIQQAIFSLLVCLSVCLFLHIYIKSVFIFHAVKYSTFPTFYHVQYCGGGDLNFSAFCIVNCWKRFNRISAAIGTWLRLWYLMVVTVCWRVFTQNQFKIIHLARKSLYKVIFTVSWWALRAECCRWRHWFRAVGTSTSKKIRIPHFSDFTFVRTTALDRE